MAVLVVSIVALVFGFVGSLPMAGPVAILVVSNAANERYAEARRTAYGAAVAEGFYAFLAFWGFATFLARHEIVLPISHGVTGAILLGLGIYFMRFEQKDEEGKGGPRKKGGPFLVGFSVAAVNPTLIASWSAVTTFLYSRQLVPMDGPLAIPFGLFAGLGITLWGRVIVWLLRRFRDHFPRKTLTWVVRGMGVLLLALGVWSLAELGRYVMDPASRPKMRAGWGAPAAAEGARDVVEAPVTDPGW
jgi:threonine/homoserine/homoserine lactone efflux protein